MPRPAYIIGAQTIIEDKETSFASAVNVIEKFTITVRTAEAVPAPSGVALISPPSPATNYPWAVMAAWIKEPGDDGVEFEHQWAIEGAVGQVSNNWPVVPFSFPDGSFMQNRFRLNLQGMLPITKAGLAIIESRIRRVGETNWKVQQFPVAVEVVGEGAEELLRDLKVEFRT